MPGCGCADTREVRVITKFFPKAVPALGIFPPCTQLWNRHRCRKKKNQFGVTLVRP